MHILLIEDEEILRVSLARELARAGHDVDAHERPASALAAIARRDFDAVITDIRMPGMNGFDLLEELERLRPDVPVVFMTAYATVRDAVRAIRMGAFDYLTKPFEVEELLVLLQRIRDLPKTGADGQEKHRTLQRMTRVEELGSSRAMRQILADLPLVASSDELILINGETGTGKEHLARIIHSHGPRADGPFLKVSCAALSAQLVESELFGHEKGAFTGAERRRIGRFERARGGTLMLDEVDDVPLSIQVKLLQVLQDGVVERVGGDQPIPVDVRVIAATKADLEGLVEAGRFRSDLFYRLNVIPLRLPPLRERREDIPGLIERLVERYTTRDPFTMSPQALHALVHYSWPGNVRELENLIKRLIALVRECPVELGHLPLEVRVEAEAPSGTRAGTYDEKIADVERKLLKEALEQAGGNKTQAAKRLGIPASTLRDKLAKHGIDA
jgi:DNA-binding NtrC family response regulator